MYCSLEVDLCVIYSVDVQSFNNLPPLLVGLFQSPIYHTHVRDAVHTLSTRYSKIGCNIHHLNQLFTSLTWVNSVHIIGQGPNRYIVVFHIAIARMRDVIQYLHSNTTGCPDTAVWHGSGVIDSWNAYCASVGWLVWLVKCQQ